jgi:hypothetical protein
MQLWTLTIEENDPADMQKISNIIRAVARSGLKYKMRSRSAEPATPTMVDHLKVKITDAQGISMPPGVYRGKLEVEREVIPASKLPDGISH